MPPGMNAPPDTWLMMRPPPRSSIDGTTAREHTSAPITLTFITRSHQSSGRVRSDPIGISFINAALLTRMSTPPNSSVAACTIAVGGVGVGDVDRHADRVAPLGAQLCGVLLGPLAVEIGEHHLRPGGGEAPAVLLAAAAGAPGDDRDLAVQREALDAHRIPPSVSSTGRVVTIPVGSRAHEDRCDARGGQHEVLDRRRAGGRGRRVRVGVAPGAPGVPGGDERAAPRRRLPPADPVEHARVRRADGAGGDRGDHRRTCGSAPTSTTSGCATRSSPPGPSPRSTCCPADGSSSASARAGWRRSGTPPASTSRRAAAGSTRPSTSAGGCGPTTSSSTTASSSTSQPVMFNPKPVQQPQPSLLIGGDGAAAKRRAALVGDGWLPMNHTLEQLPGALAEINEKRVGRRSRRRHDPHRRRQHRVAGRRRALPRRRTSTACSCAPSPTSREALDRHRPLRRRDHRQAHPDHTRGCVADRVYAVSDATWSGGGGGR